MKKLLLLTIYGALFFVMSGMSQLRAQVWLDVETGAVFTGYNDVGIPGDLGTRFSLNTDFEASPKIFYRLRMNYTIGERHTISALYAPLTIKSVGAAPFEIFFEGVTFPAGTNLDATYKFNSYRLTYRYEIVRKEKVSFGLGFTAKIRDAKIGLASQTSESVKTNVGFVPIINFRLVWNPDDKYGLVLEGDALAAPQGRAEDVLLAGTWKLSEKLRLKAGYRILEGGADNDEVYSFALFHYGVAGFYFSF